MKLSSFDTIVAAVDGSKASRGVLMWALNEAQLRGARVRAVMAWQIQSYSPYPVGAALLPEGTLGNENTHDQLERLIDSFGPELRNLIDPVVLHGGAAEALIQESKSADLLVMGSRGHGSFLGTVLGSISQHVSAHAHCPVVVIQKHVAEEMIDLTSPAHRVAS